MSSFNPDAYFISNGPGDPEPLEQAIQTAKDIIASDAPLFGICLGHQVIALANGISTYKMHNGHRGIEITHVHLNDQTVAGIRMKNKNVFSVQYHPEASPGPNDAKYLFDQFFDLIKKNTEKTVSV